MDRLFTFGKFMASGGCIFFGRFSLLRRLHVREAVPRRRDNCASQEPQIAVFRLLHVDSIFIVDHSGGGGHLTSRRTEEKLNRVAEATDSRSWILTRVERSCVLTEIRQDDVQSSVADMRLSVGTKKQVTFAGFEGSLRFGLPSTCLVRDTVLILDC